MGPLFSIVPIPVPVLCSMYEPFYIAPSTAVLFTTVMSEHASAMFIMAMVFPNIKVSVILYTWYIITSQHFCFGSVANKKGSF